MNETTRPGEISRIAASEIDFRVEVLTGIARLEAKIDGHVAEDARQFTDLNSRIVGVSSNVATEQLNSRYTFRELVTGILVLCGAIGSLIGFIVWAIGNASSKP